MTRSAAPEAGALPGGGGGGSRRVRLAGGAGGRGGGAAGGAPRRRGRALPGGGWRVIPAGSGSQARQMAGREDFEIAVVDNRLPDERGVQGISAGQKPGGSTVAARRDEDTMDRIVGIELGA